ASNNERARRTGAAWPEVTGSNEPGQTAIRDFTFPTYRPPRPHRSTPSRLRSSPIRVHLGGWNHDLEAVANCAAWVLGVWLVGWEDGVWRSRTVRWIVIRRSCCLLICGSGCRLSTWCG